MFKRGDIVILNLNNNVGKPRPALIIQNDILNECLKTTVLIPFTSDLHQEVDTFRYIIKKLDENGLQSDSQLMIDKISQIRISQIKATIGKVDKKQIREIESRLLAVLGIN